MQQALKWILPLLVLASILLSISGVLPANTALIVGGMIEGLALVIVIPQGIRIWRRYRQDRAAGRDWEAALEEAIALLFPRRLARLVALEPRLWICLAQWLFRRRPLAPDEFSYAKRSMMGGMLALVVFSAPAEVLLFELLIPWPLVKAILLIGSVYSVIWFVGYYASLQVLPYRLEPDALRLRYGIMADGRVPYSQIAAVLVERHKAADEGLRVDRSTGTATIAAGGCTDVTLQLHAPLVLHGLLAPRPPIHTLHLAADDPARFAAALQARLDTTSTLPAAPLPLISLLNPTPSVG